MGGVCVMLLGGKGGCQQCTCVPCDECTRTCTEPHSGAAFEAVYTRFFEGVEVGNPADGYLSASGDNDTSDPYNGMDGTGPWFQQVGGGFSDGGSYGGGTRFPCTYRFSFWRSSYTLGTATIPPASTALTENVITVTVSTGAVVFPDGRVFTADDGPVTLASVPLVSGGALAADPRTNDGTVSFALQCQNVETTFSVQARISWATQKRQHVLYGIVRECYEEGTPCATACSGSPPPASLYLTISNYTGPTIATGTPNGTYVLDRVPNYCNWYLGNWGWGCLALPLDVNLEAGNDDVSAYMDANARITANSWQIIDGNCRLLVLWVNTSYNPTTLTSFCGTGVLASGTNGVVLLATAIPVTSGDIVSGSFDWEISA